ncbi:putative aldouronate transport system permease protein [Paenibacillus phyllosphaerae]|uniref:Putative aldouronate transport system permease protein n=1 Tax=Paenibacillus phyllosphaerae TaxID=274593 RepID=A0A7W5ASS3_9BACL|nr:sugar ABC transporter permease [Paenibacillus phyllosphaerae]MBB3108105.1 putative aldouronate transport system permease protein [Paenibacillus phyllosphaerae]
MLIARLMRNRWLYLMVLPGLLYFLIFKYWPMYGIFIAFKDYQPYLGFWDSPFVGFKHFDRLFSDPNFIVLFRNTFILALYNILFFFPLPILVALMLNELRHELSKRIVQTLVYIPHFMSWVVVVGIAYMFLTTEGGFINVLLEKLGGEKVTFLVSNEWFRTIITTEVMWKETGWGTIIFLAALSGVDPQLYEAARMDGANRLRQLWHITLPAIRSTIIILLILRLGHFLDTGFEQIFLMLNAMNREVGEVFDTYVYAVGISQGQYSFSTAVGLFKSIVGLILVVLANRLAKKFGEEGIY